MTLKKIIVLSEDQFTNILIVGKAIINNIPITFFLRRLDDGLYESIIYETLNYSLSENLEETLFKNFKNFIQDYKENFSSFMDNIKDNIKSDWNILWFRKLHELFVLSYINNNKSINNYNILKNNILKKFPEITFLKLYNTENL